MKKDQKIKISVIIPAYNTEAYLERAVKSVCAQTYDKTYMEIIIVDDGSTDDTGKIADRLAAEHDGIHVFHQANAGLSAARNVGILKATGDFLGFVDSDDYIAPSMYETLANLAISTGALVVQAGRTEISETGERLQDVVQPSLQVETISAQAYLKSLLLHEGDSSFCTKLMARSLFSGQNLFKEGRYNEDFLLLINMIPVMGPLVKAPIEGYFVVYRSGSLTRKATGERDSFPLVYRDIVRNADEAYTMVCRSFPELEEVAMRFSLVQRLDYLLHIPVSLMKKHNKPYMKVKKYLSAHRQEIRINPYLSDKQRKNLLILSYAPKFSRSLHAVVMKLRKKRGN